MAHSTLVRGLLVAVAFSFCLTLAVSLEAREEEAVSAIKGLVDRINLAWKEEGGVRHFQEILSDRAFTVAIPRPKDPSLAAIADKGAYCTAFDMLMKNPPQRHEHIISGITVAGPIACEIGTSVHVAADGSEGRREILNVFAKDETGWKLVFSTHADNIRKALSSNPEDEKIVRELVQEFIVAFRTDNPTSADRLKEILAEDFIQIGSNGILYEGRDANLQIYDESMEEIRKAFSSFSVTYDIRSLNVSGNGATVFGKLVMEGRFKDGDRPYRRDIWETLVFRRYEAGWRLVQEHSTQAPSGFRGSRR